MGFDPPSRSRRANAGADDFRARGIPRDSRQPNPCPSCCLRGPHRGVRSTGRGAALRRDGARRHAPRRRLTRPGRRRGGARGEHERGAGAGGAVPGDPRSVRVRHHERRRRRRRLRRGRVGRLACGGSTRWRAGAAVECAARARDGGRDIPPSRASMLLSRMFEPPPPKYRSSSRSRAGRPRTSCLRWHAGRKPSSSWSARGDEVRSRRPCLGRFPAGLSRRPTGRSWSCRSVPRPGLSERRAHHERAARAMPSRTPPRGDAR